MSVSYYVRSLHHGTDLHQISRDGFLGFGLPSTTQILGNLDLSSQFFLFPKYPHSAWLKVPYSMIIVLKDSIPASNFPFFVFHIFLLRKMQWRTPVLWQWRMPFMPYSQPPGCTSRFIEHIRISKPHYFLLEERWRYSVCSPNDKVLHSCNHPLAKLSVVEDCLGSKLMAVWMPIVSDRSVSTNLPRKNSRGISQDRLELQTHYPRYSVSVAPQITLK